MKLQPASKKEVIRNTYAYDVISGNSHYTHSTYEN